jgi:hypothetical protein
VAAAASARAFSQRLLVAGFLLFGVLSGFVKFALCLFLFTDSLADAPLLFALGLALLLEFVG